MRPLQILKWVVIPLLLILLMQFRPEGIMGRRELPELTRQVLKRFSGRSAGGTAAPGAVARGGAKEEDRGKTS
jgi:branched-chain amino acid transport system permease protein